MSSTYEIPLLITVTDKGGVRDEATLRRALAAALETSMVADALSHQNLALQDIQLLQRGATR